MKFATKCVTIVSVLAGEDLNTEKKEGKEV